MADSEFEPKKLSRGIFSRSKKWYNCSYEVRATVGPADLTFELWFKGKKISENHGPIKIIWNSDGAASIPRDSTSETASASEHSPAGSTSEQSKDPSETRYVKMKKKTMSSIFSVLSQ